MLKNFILFIVKIINNILNKILKVSDKVNNDSIRNKTVYSTKKFMTDSELNFFNKLKFFENNYRVVPQLNLATVIKKQIIINIQVNYLEILILQFFQRIIQLYSC